MLNQHKRESHEAVQLLGECHPLLEQLGSADGLFTLSGMAAALNVSKVDTASALVRFLDAYLSQVLLPLDLPAICRAHGHASRNEARELLALDAEIARQMKHRDL